MHKKNQLERFENGCIKRWRKRISNVDSCTDQVYV